MHLKRYTAAGLLPFVICATWQISSGNVQEHVHPHDDSLPDIEYKVGKKGEMNVRVPMDIGRATLKKARYIVTHDVDSEGHWFTFTHVPGRNETLSPPIRVRSDLLLPTFEKESRSILYARSHHDHDVRRSDQPDYQVIRILWAGETVEHLF